MWYAAPYEDASIFMWYSEAEREAHANTPMQRARRLSHDLRCNCDLDNWQPEVSTGHSWICRIHRAALNLLPLPRNHYE